MIYRVCEHYYNDEIDYNKKVDECLVCLEYEIQNNMMPVSLKDILFIKKCNCDAWIHECCLNDWLKKNYKCPICRIEISKQKKKTYIVNIYWYGLMISSINFIYQMIRFSIFFVLFYSSFIYFMMTFITQTNNIRAYGDIYNKQNSNRYVMYTPYIPIDLKDLKYNNIYQNISNQK
jgi:hypothetical protein